ncbi:ribonuclease Z [Algoriphagus marincola]|uniref:Ribonuclease Z n=1 Tax=Algoriphagus marincola TaxID=264027 RepID=A0ABS7N312_9BACT|nr:ribonuclease Z [Algoriphagus marincola]MBY5950391.1 ribonuclease Z [Algoriphagus marincola]
MRPEFEVTILGNTSSIPVHGRNHTSQLVKLGSELMLIDCGEGTQMQLRRFRLKYSKINYIFISHLHGDHYFGLIGLLSSFHLARRSNPLTIFGPKGLDEIISTHLRWSNTQLTYSIDFHITTDDGLNLLVNTPQLMVYSFPLRHRLPTTGFLIKEKAGLRNLIKSKLEAEKLSVEAIQSLRKGMDYIGVDGSFYPVREYCYPQEATRTYAYCSDTIYWPELKEYIAGVDLLYHESTFLDAEKERAELTMHSTAGQAASIAAASSVKKMILGHFSSRYKDLNPMLEEAKPIFENVELSVEGETYRL